jgi:predicted Zn-dependent protease with MMP-like domain
MNDEEFERLVVEALEALPEEFQRALDNVEVFIERRPLPHQRRAAGLKPWQGGTLYGLYEGIPLPARDGGYTLVPPDMITLFSDALRRDFPAPATLREQVRRTVLHELAHYFGIDDDRLHDLGAY